MTYLCLYHTTIFSKNESVLMEFSEKTKQPSRELGYFIVGWILLFQNTAIALFQHYLNERPSHVWLILHFVVE